MKVSLVVCMSSNSVIGNNGVLPWDLKADLRRFRMITLNRTVVMGRKTYESIGKPLSNRNNIVVTSNTDFHAKECIICHDVEELINSAKAANHRLYVIGGAEIYNTFMEYADQILLTEIDKYYEGDTFFPLIDSKKWQKEGEDEVIRNDPEFEHSYRYIKYIRTRK